VTTWSPQQDEALRLIGKWLKDKHGPQVFYLAGYAGTGKSTIAREAAALANGEVKYAAFTGKAALVMRQKGCEAASTIHQLIYKLDDDTGGVPVFKLNHNGPLSTATLAVIDECSMVGRELGEDLLSFGKKVLVLGDPAQLPPVKDAGYFTAREPDHMLTEVHRQARDNPIIAMSMHVREGNRLQPGEWGASRIIDGDRRIDIQPSVLAAQQVIVGKNLTRRTYNDRVRSLKGFTVKQAPMPGDRLICLKNRHQQGLLNGSMWTAESVHHDNRLYTMRVSSQDYGPETQHQQVTVPEEFFTGHEQSLDYVLRRTHDEFDFGYVITCHKAQGSQWPDVFIFDESQVFREDRHRHLYTAITRASEKVTVVL